MTTQSELSGTFERRIERTVIHERWNTQSLINDIALVRISGDALTYNSRVRAACLPYDYQV